MSSKKNSENKKDLITKIIFDALKDNKLKIKPEDIASKIEIPPSAEMGDFAFPCFFLSPLLKQSPGEIAMEVRAKIGTQKDFSDIQTMGPYINFFFDRKELASETVSRILSEKDKFGSSQSGKNTRTVIEFPSPNTNKPLHLGHLRNMSLGESVSRILEYNGNNVIRTNVYNDRGVHICKSMLAYEKFGKDKTPESEKKKSDHLVGDFYVKFSEEAKKDPALETEAQEMLRKWEAGDPEVIELWKKMNSWVIEGIEETFRTFGLRFDKTYYESKLYKNGKEEILKGLKKGLFKKRKDGAIIADLSKKGLGEKVLLRADGTSVYIVFDLALAKAKEVDFHPNKSIIVTGNEQIYHFNVLFEVLKMLGFKQKNYHLSHGMVNLPEGKMKSREGTIVDADDLIEKIQDMVKKEISKRGKLSKAELESRSLKITLAAIKYFILKVDAKRDMIFNPKESISFEGDTGPYLLYSYARANSILKKTLKKESSVSKTKLEEKEISLVKKLSEFSRVVSKSYETLNPANIANYAYQLSQVFNEFYHACPVVKSKNESFRLSLVKSFMQVLKNSLNLLGIETLEEM